MSFVRFFGVWLLGTTAVAVYAVGDLRLNEWIESEQYLIIQPNLAKIGDLWHVGGRLLHHSPGGFLMNAFLFGGFVALAVDALAKRRRPHA